MSPFLVTIMFTYPFRTGEQRALFAVSLICIVIDVVIVGLRLFAARRVQRPYDWSDASLVMALVSRQTPRKCSCQRERDRDRDGADFCHLFLATDRFVLLVLVQRSWLVSARHLADTGDC